MRTPKTITITIEETEPGKLRAEHYLNGIDELTAAVMLHDIAKNLFVAVARHHHHHHHEGGGTNDVQPIRGR